MHWKCSKRTFFRTFTGMFPGQNAQILKTNFFYDQILGNVPQNATEKLKFFKCVRNLRFIGKVDGFF